VVASALGVAENWSSNGCLELIPPITRFDWASMSEEERRDIARKDRPSGNVPQASSNWWPEMDENSWTRRRDDAKP